MAESDEKLASTVAQHYNKLQEGGIEQRTQSRIFYMRNFNNWIKSILINEFLTKIKKDIDGAPLAVLDLCSGKGGDLLKWKKGNIDQLVCTDIAETSVEQSESRYKENVDRNRKERYPSKMFSAEFIPADSTKLRLKDMYKDKDTLFNLTSCQFSFHYCFESLPQAEMMIKNACECLKPGGYFVGTTPNSNELVRRLRASEDMSFGNEVYKITFLTKDKENMPLFGAKYDFHLEGVVDCPEFLVYFPAFEKLAEKYGMKLVFKKPFAAFFDDNCKTGDGRSLLGKMQALEALPPDESVNLMSTADNAYTNAEAYVKTLISELEEQSNYNKNRPPKIGTLSQAEWEASTIYLAFAFRKDGGAEDNPSNIDEPSETNEVPLKRPHSPTLTSQDEPQEKLTRNDSDT